jgi:hypothetical protein
MKRILFAVVFQLFIMQISTYGQFKGPLMTEGRLPPGEKPVSQMKTAPESSDDMDLAARIIKALKRLDGDVLVYRSLGEFEASGKLSSVPFDVFKNDLQQVTAEVEPMLSELRQSSLKIMIGNALASYRDGAFWWHKIHQPRVVNIAAMSFAETTRTPSDSFFASTTPYTVAMHWRQAAKYLRRAEDLMNLKK